MFTIFPKEVSLGFSQKADGDMLLVGPRKAQNHRNRVKFFKKNKINPATVRAVMLQHNSAVKTATGQNQEVVGSADGLVSKEKNIALTVTGADCFPVFAYDPSAKVIGIAHCSWRSASKGLVLNFVKKMRALGAEPDKILAGIGPGLQKCHFEIQQDVADFFEQYGGIVKNIKGKKYLNLLEFIHQQLKEAGVSSNNIENNPECTHCEEEKYFSYRRDKPEEIQAMVAYIYLKS